MKQILVVDDDPALLDAILRSLRSERSEWRVTTAGNGHEALRAAEGQTFDVLLTDLLMPEKDGIETIMAFRREHPTTKIVAMSGGGRHVGTQPLDYVRQLGADATLEKPFDAKHLREVIRGLLDSQSHPEPGKTV